MASVKEVLNTRKSFENVIYKSKWSEGYKCRETLNTKEPAKAQLVRSISEEEAAEFIDYNVIRALPYFKNAPIVMYNIF